MPPLKVFIVEDSATIRQNLAATLEECAPVRVVGATGGACEAIARLTVAEPRFDLAIVDLLLQQGSGIEVLAALQRAASPMRRVVLTNCAIPALRAQCLALGAERVFDKSGDIDGLLDYCAQLAADPTRPGTATSG